MTDVVKPVCEACNQRIVGGGYKRGDDKHVRWCAQCKPADAVRGQPFRRSKPAIRTWLVAAQEASSYHEVQYSPMLLLLHCIRSDTAGASN
jgi:hypothetical protein